jgi:predicted nucleic acid-binding protein
LWRSEFANVLNGYLHKGALTLDDALLLLEQGLRLLSGNEYLVDMVKVIELAADSSCSAYDCEFVALAKALSIPLVTADRKIIKQFSGIAQSPEMFLG